MAGIKPGIFKCRRDQNSRNHKRALQPPVPEAAGRGSVIIFDNRVARKNYGRRFLRSLPDCKTIIGPKDKVFAELKEIFVKP